ncbi:esiB [Symbiodinium pilosum]|uniref:EsiB protein n=1 Tax=Symbiodinium pilosum TaxID=2952 RepID=A0A812QQP0_SYMPI|nr:esiB [Symbiodinium pilosum]
MKLSGFMPQETARALLSTVQSSRSYDSEPDSVDHMPSFEFYPMIAGQWVDETMKHLLHEFAETVVLPYVRQTYSCPECAVADLLVRRYVVGERRTHQLHFDSHAYATVVLGLSDPSDFEGGLYIQPGTHASTRQFVNLEPGDLFVHSFDLQHGVRLWKGTRHSVVFWIKTSARSITKGTTPWYSKAAETGDPDALFNLGEQYLHGTAGMTMNPSRAAALYKQAAESGHHGAQTHLGLLLAETGGSDLRESAKWLKLSAKAGSVLGQKSLAFAYANGRGVEQNLTRASKWMMRAAQQDDLEAAYVLGTMYLHGQGLKVSPVDASYWLRLSAEAGYADAQREMLGRQRASWESQESPPKLVRWGCIRDHENIMSKRLER